MFIQDWCGSADTALLELEWKKMNRREKPVVIFPNGRRFYFVVLYQMIPFSPKYWIIINSLVAYYTWKPLQSLVTKCRWLIRRGPTLKSTLSLASNGFEGAWQSLSRKGSSLPKKNCFKLLNRQRWFSTACAKETLSRDHP